MSCRKSPNERQRQPQQGRWGKRHFRERNCELMRYGNGGEIKADLTGCHWLRKVVQNSERDEGTHWKSGACVPYVGLQREAESRHGGLGTLAWPSLWPEKILWGNCRTKSKPKGPNETLGENKSKRINDSSILTVSSSYLQSWWVLFIELCGGYCPKCVAASLMHSTNSYWAFPGGQRGPQRASPTNQAETMAALT